MRRKWIAVIGMAPVWFSCEGNSASADAEKPPAWIEARIAEYGAAPVATPPRVITGFAYKGSEAYLISSPCCDQFDSLFDARQNYLCAPLGGFDGHGDGKCPEFDLDDASRTVIWRDERSR